MTSGSFEQLIEQAKSVAILTHLDPDYDALGAAASVTLAYSDKSVVTVISKPVIEKGPLFFEKLKISNTIPCSTDLILILDCADSKRTGYGQQLKQLHKKVTLVVIDHHKELGDLSKLTPHYIHKPKASSTCEILADILFKNNKRVTKIIATALLAGIVSDTQGFQHSPNQIATFKTASKLISLGAQHQQIIECLVPNLTLKQKKLWGALLTTTTVSPTGIVRTILTQELQEKYKATQTDLTGLTTLLSLSSEAKMAVLAIEEENSWKIILRSRHLSVALNKIAKIFGGGGKPRLAVFRVTKTAFSSKIFK